MARRRASIPGHPRMKPAPAPHKTPQRQPKTDQHPTPPQTPTTHPTQPQQKTTPNKHTRNNNKNHQREQKKPQTRLFFPTPDKNLDVCGFFWAGSLLATRPRGVNYRCLFESRFPLPCLPPHRKFDPTHPPVLALPPPRWSSARAPPVPTPAYRGGRAPPAVPLVNPPFPRYTPPRAAPG